MSGHSKWANIKNRKNSQDAKKAKIFGKLSRLITLAVKKGKSPDLDVNPYLRQVVDRARSENMPKDNILRAISNASKSQDSMEEFLLEGYGPGGVAILLEIVTDSRQRTIQEMKSVFDRRGGSLAEPGAVAYLFQKRGLIVLKDPKDEAKILELIDLGADDFEKEKGKVVVLVTPKSLDEFRGSALEAGFDLETAELVYEPRSAIKVKDKETKNKLIDLLSLLEDHDDIQNVFTNFDAED